jgi:hypothetical protein
MAVVIFDSKRQRLVANCGGRFPTEEHAMSLRLRRLFYVGKFAAIGVLGPSVNGVYHKDVMRALTMATARFEKTGIYEIPLERFTKSVAFGKGETRFIIMTKKGLYEVYDDGVRLLDDSETQAHGVMAGVFNVVNTTMNDIEKSLAYMATTTSFITTDNLSVARKDCGDVFDLDSKDEFSTTMRTDSR